jgi:hypothetical protein
LGVGEDLEGLGLGGVGIKAGGNLRGIALGGMVAVGKNITGLTLGVVGVRAKKRVSGITASLVSIGAPAMRGVMVSSLNGVVFEDFWFRKTNQKMNGISIGLLNTTSQLRGVQLGLLNYAGNNPRWLRLLPLVNLHL